MSWYKFIPSDTFFLRGAEPLAAGMEYETPTIFPPAPSVLCGAMRTAVLSQNDITIRQFKKGVSDLERYIGKFGASAPFSVTGVFLACGDTLYVPTPYNWMTESEKNSDEIAVVIPELLPAHAKKLGICGSYRSLYWGKHAKDLRSLGGSWVSLPALQQKKKKLKVDTDILLNTDSFITQEERTGIALDANRSVKKSQLYTGRHLRLAEGWSLVWSTDRDTGLASSGVMTIGGEQRFGTYEEIDSVNLNKNTELNAYMCTTPVLATTEVGEKVIASGKLVYRGGWSLAKQFHKPMVGYYPAGTVFSSKIDKCCISL
ncbi:type III-B CRISPR module-associated Cmr3 family protein [Chitinivibrio alkaliphilus]|uniref:CRISPR/Cas system-associated RAMP superfamily protein Cmr3 n=1 Tax=Chitinivibrio alkaliphilus ACht1 TaxID=1313304 RepID=U7D8L6_9BACT|nr:type III-B CRISPR module-associated Cmr3 family protein [Chitinivibrio alkaliphilus]ERP30775.1 CRISPR/Cas system-associated RAMP superfamily protein Cmr3 [Chitinivibrio alkaliphilus ACht1]